VVGILNFPPLYKEKYVHKPDLPVINPNV
jgi:hypothetical protein